MDGINNLTCVCPPGFTDQSCGTNLDECSSHPCVNQGTCADGADDFSFDCSVGFTGKRCEINIDDCPENKCKMFEGTGEF